MKWWHILAHFLVAMTTQCARSEVGLRGNDASHPTDIIHPELGLHRPDSLWFP